MKGSLFATLFAAPLALVSALQADLVARGDGMESKDKYYGYNNEGGSTVIVEEIVLVWVNSGGGSATTTVNAMSSMTNTATGATHSVTVGGSAGLVYTPDTLEAAVGDMVVFTFLSQNHTVTQAAFAKPCVRIPGFDSGFMPNPNSTVNPPPQMGMMVNVATPLWFYCRQKGHCGKGMVFSINPTANKTQAMFEQMAIAQNGTGTTAGIVATSAPVAATTMATVAVAASVTYTASATYTASVSPPQSTYAGMVQGSGSGSGDSCSCSCFCGVAQFPSAVQGLEGYGGMSGSMPMAAMMKS